MGGSALLIHGTMAAARLAPRPVARTILDRLLGRERTAAPAWRAISASRRMIDVPSAHLDPMMSEFRRYARDQFAVPWAATRVVLDYLNDVRVTTLSVRGDVDAERPAEWYVQLAFAGCAGMAQVSSEVAAHWAAAWYQREQAELRSTFLVPYGFEPNDQVEAVGGTVFVPLGVCGYARVASVSPDPLAPADEPAELDGVVFAALSEAERAVRLARVDDELRRMRVDRCLCQVCAPDLDVGAFDGLL